MDGGWAPLMGREVYSRQITLSLFDFFKKRFCQFYEVVSCLSLTLNLRLNF